MISDESLPVSIVYSKTMPLKVLFLQASILSAVEEKVRRRIWEEFSTLKAEHMSLQKISEDLNNGKLR